MDIIGIYLCLASPFALAGIAIWWSCRGVNEKCKNETEAYTNHLNSMATSLIIRLINEHREYLRKTEFVNDAATLRGRERVLGELLLMRRVISSRENPQA